MAALTVQTLVDAGTKPTFAAPTLTDTADLGNGKNTFLVYKNTDASNIKTVTITVPGNNSYGQANPDPAITVGTVTGEVWIPLRKEYDDLSGNNVAAITISGTGGVTGLTCALVRVNWA